MFAVIVPELLIEISLEVHDILLTSNVPDDVLSIALYESISIPLIVNDLLLVINTLLDVEDIEESPESSESKMVNVPLLVICFVVVNV